MFWIILGVICVIAIIVGICVAAFCEWHDVEGVATAVIAGGVLLLLVLCAPVIAAQDKQEINQFKNQKEYIENHEVKDSIENAALTTKKIELNAWLIDTQYAKVHYSFFTFLPDEVMELTPIN